MREDIKGFGFLFTRFTASVVEGCSLLPLA